MKMSELGCKLHPQNFLRETFSGDEATLQFFILLRSFDSSAREMVLLRVVKMRMCLQWIRHAFRPGRTKA